MANETPKKPIKRATVPTVSKEVPANFSAEKKESKAKRNTLLVILFLVIAVILYLVLFQRPLLSKYIPLFSGKEKPVIVADTTAISSDTLAEEDVNTFLGQPNPGAVVYPEGSQFYLVAGTFIFYPYAEKFRDKMTGEGYQAGIVSSGTPRQFHRVYILSSEDPAEVRAKRDELRSTQNMDVWVYAE